MKNSLPLFLLIACCSSLLAETNPAASTKLEEMLGKKNCLIINTSKKIGRIDALSGRARARFEKIDTKDLSAGGETANGIKVTVILTEPEKTAESYAFLDSEELPGILDSLKIIAGLIKQQNKKDYINAAYRTKGNFRIGFYAEGNDSKIFFSCEKPSLTIVEFQTKRIDEIINIISASINELKKG
ncbi:hypothetical protein KKF70_00525 [bacterium]|nr:hypothetical protein [Candidatus Omnitrophota bacterium]MBU2527858.1 hypothetical protein [bacterium]MBU3929211.1 hypothetical protein [bacterium]MBU4122256.1 hypothetical protein [bacterium]